MKLPNWALLLLLIIISSVKLTSLSTEPPNYQADSPIIQRSDSALHKQDELRDFSNFLRVLEQGLQRQDKKMIVALCVCPIVVKGELDEEGQVELSGEQLGSFIDEFIKEEVYFTINDHLLTSTYGSELKKAAEKSYPLEQTEHDIQGMQFQLIDGVWKLTQITTYHHIIDRLRNSK